MEFHSLAAPHPESALVDPMPNYDRFPPHTEQRLPDGGFRKARTVMAASRSSP